MSRNETHNSDPFDLQAFLKNLTTHPGVYRMINQDGAVIYVGKAANLKKRVGSYFSGKAKDAKTLSMVSQINRVEITITRSESDALLLEAELIKQLKPRYNILLRDDKSYPYIHLSAHAFPRLTFYRGSRAKKQGKFFGPYPSTTAMRETVNVLQKAFLLRSCRDTFFANRSRPCLQYQIKRCSAPCVGLISAEDYARDIDSAERFLDGRNDIVIDELVERMEQSSAQLKFEEAARLRDQVAALRKASEIQFASDTRVDSDAIAVVERNGLYCVAVLFIRGGRLLGSHTWFPSQTANATSSEVLAAFLMQYYLDRLVPAEIVLNHAIDDAVLIEKTLAQRRGSKVILRHHVRRERTRWLQQAERNAEQALVVKLASDLTVQSRYQALQEALQLDEPPARMECFDISHTSGEATVASCVVFGAEGAMKSQYRRFNIEGIEPGDDYAAMRQALTRRYTRLKRGEAALPDILFIDGGKGQLRQAAEVLEELQIADVLLVGIAKGAERKPGLEQLFLVDRSRPLILPADSPALHLIQQIRDEAHRFAVAGHTQRRNKARRESTLESIDGLGPKRRQQLLKAFGGLQGVTAAGIEDIARVKGISQELATRVFEYFHGTNE